MTALPPCNYLTMSPKELDKEIDVLWTKMEISKNYFTYKLCWDQIDRLRAIKYPQPIKS